MKIWNLQSLLVCTIIPLGVSSTEDDRIFGWLSRLAFPILNWCTIFIIFHCGWMKRLVDRWIPLIQLSRMRCWWRRKLQKRFPKCYACPKCLAAHLCGSALPENGLASRQDHDKVGKTLVDRELGNVHSVPIQHLENLSNHSYNYFHSVFSWIFAVSSRTVSRSSINFFPWSCIECRPLKSLQFFHFFETLLMSLTKILILLQKSAWTSGRYRGHCFVPF